jgi:hypothetical protein
MSHPFSRHCCKRRLWLSILILLLWRFSNTNSPSSFLSSLSIRSSVFTCSCHVAALFASPSIVPTGKLTTWRTPLISQTSPVRVRLTAKLGIDLIMLRSNVLVQGNSLSLRMSTATTGRCVHPISPSGHPDKMKETNLHVSRGWIPKPTAPARPGCPNHGAETPRRGRAGRRAANPPERGRRVHHTSKPPQRVPGFPAFLWRYGVWQGGVCRLNGAAVKDRLVRKLPNRQTSNLPANLPSPS